MTILKKDAPSESVSKPPGTLNIKNKIYFKLSIYLCFIDEDAETEDVGQVDKESRKHEQNDFFEGQ